MSERIARAIDKGFAADVGNDGAGWGVYMEDDESVHVQPEFGPEHRRTFQCWCHPSIEIYDVPLVIHNAAH